MSYITNYNGLDANKYNGSNDFRGFLAANGYEKFLPYVGNDGCALPTELSRRINELYHINYINVNMVNWRLNQGFY